MDKYEALTIALDGEYGNEIRREEDALDLAEHIARVLDGFREEVDLEGESGNMIAPSSDEITRTIRDWIQNRSNTKLHIEDLRQSVKGSYQSGGVNVIGLPGLPGLGCSDTLIVYAPDKDARKRGSLRQLMKHVTYTWAQCNTKYTIFICDDSEMARVQNDWQKWFGGYSSCKILVPIKRIERTTYHYSIKQPRLIK